MQFSQPTIFSAILTALWSVCAAVEHDAGQQDALDGGLVEGHLLPLGDAVLPGLPLEVQSLLSLLQQHSGVQSPGQVLLCVDSTLERVADTIKSTRSGFSSMMTSLVLEVLSNRSTSQFLHLLPVCGFTPLCDQSHRCGFVCKLQDGVTVAGGGAVVCV